MKKVLFATTALVASAGIASAQGVSLSGSAEMGIVGGSGHGDEVQFWHDLDVRFTLSGETDGGLTFGATIDLDEVGDDTCSLGIGATGSAGCVEEQSVFISGAFGTVTIGDTDGAFDWALADAAIGGAIDDAHTTHAGFSGTSGLDGIYDGQIARYDYSFGDFAFAASVELDDTGVGDPAFGLGFTYSASLSGTDLGFGLGYQTADTGAMSYDIWGASVDASFGGGFQVVLEYQELDGFGGNDSHVGVGLGYSMDAITLGANWGQYDTTAGDSVDGWGVAANYDLGGGAEVQFGYGQDDTYDWWSLGIAMSF
ncbi:porin [Pseudoruegeria sp. HB172150]|uniref:porin n=1 Tax=Pseudoruegeria sp. HB172150 TaxID=2721164 RepID=UPI0015565BEA|nr:porin [Pseudoruegeria sp. HB172150]